LGQVLDLLLDDGLNLGFGLFQCAARRHHAGDSDVKHQLKLVNVSCVMKPEGVFASEKMSIR